MPCKLTNQNNPNEEIQIRHLDAIVSLWKLNILFDFHSLYNNHLVIAPKTPECLWKSWKCFRMTDDHYGGSSLCCHIIENQYTTDDTDDDQGTTTTTNNTTETLRRTPRRLWGGRWTPAPERRRSDYCQEQQPAVGGSLREQCQNRRRVYKSCSSELKMRPRE